MLGFPRRLHFGEDVEEMNARGSRDYRQLAKSLGIPPVPQHLV